MIQHCGPRPDDLSPFPPQVAGSAHLGHSTLWGREILPLGESALPCGLFGSIDIYDPPLVPQAVRQIAGRNDRFPRHAIGAKERSQSLHSGLISSDEKTRERRTIWPTAAAKEGHKDLGQRLQPLVKGFQGRFPTESIANEHHDKIDGVGCSNARTGETDLLLDSGEQVQLGQHVREDGSLSQPGWG